MKKRLCRQEEEVLLVAAAIARLGGAGAGWGWFWWRSCAGAASCMSAATFRRRRRCCYCCRLIRAKDFESRSYITDERSANEFFSSRHWEWRTLGFYVSTSPIISVNRQHQHRSLIRRRSSTSTASPILLLLILVVPSAVPFFPRFYSCSSRGLVGARKIITILYNFPAGYQLAYVSFATVILSSSGTCTLGHHASFIHVGLFASSSVMVCCIARECISASYGMHLSLVDTIKTRRTQKRTIAFSTPTIVVKNKYAKYLNVETYKFLLGSTLFSTGMSSDIFRHTSSSSKPSLTLPLRAIPCVF